VGYKFSLVLSREITDSETAVLQNAGCASAIFTTDSLPTNADVAVTRLDFDDTVSPSLTEAIESALAAVKEVPDLNVPGLTVPAQPAKSEAETEATAEVAAEEQSAAKKPAAKKRASTKKADAEANGHASADLVDAAAKSE
jgi:hypothetical protein